MNTHDINFEAEIKEHYNYLYNTACYYLNDTHLAYDALQDTCIKAYNSLNKFKNQSSFKTYLTRILINTCYDYLRKNKHVILEFDERIKLISSSNPHSDLEQKETNERILKAIHSLPRKYKEVILLKDIQDLTYDEISQTLKISLSSVKTRIFRARQQLREILEKGDL